MEENYEAAFCEVLEVIAHSEPQVKEKIPQSFIDFLIENRDPNYDPVIDFTDPKWDEKLRVEARAVIGLIYRDFIASKDEKDAFIALEKEAAIKAEKELRERYNPDNIFKKPEPKVEIKEETIIENVPAEPEEKGSEEKSLVEKESPFKNRLLGFIDIIKNTIESLKKRFLNKGGKRVKK